MNATSRIFWLLALTIFTCGCSTIRTVNLPGDDPRPGELEDTEHVVGIGDRVTLELTDGSQLTGTILEITDVTVSLQEDEPLAGHEIESSPVKATSMTVIPREEITTSYIKEGDPGKSMLLVGLIGLTVISFSAADFSSGGDKWDGTWEGGIMTH